MGLRGKDYVKQIDILRAIKLNEPVSGPQLAKILNRTRQALHIRLKQMERRGLIERVPPSPEAPVVPVFYRCSAALRELERKIAAETEAD